MSDLEIVKRCAEVMGWHTGRPAKEVVAFAVADCAVIAGNDQGGESVYDPLHDKAEAFELVEKLRLLIGNSTDHWIVGPPYDDGDVVNADLCRAICECVAQMTPHK